MEEPDFDFDNSDRIARRIAHGVYRIVHNRKEVGEELWGIFGLRGGGYRLMTEIDLKWPVPNQQRAQLDLDTEWRERKLSVQLDSQGKRRNAYYTPCEAGAEVDVFEEPLRYGDPGKSIGKANGDQPFQAIAPPKPKRMFGDTLPFDDTTFFDFGSTLMNFVHLKRLNLRLGAKVPMRAIVVAQPSLEPLTIAQVYGYVRNEVITTTVQPALHAQRYVIEEQSEAGDAPTTTLWTDEHGVAVRLEVLLGKDTHGCELISYTWQAT